MLHRKMVLSLADCKERRKKASDDQEWWCEFYRWCHDMIKQGQTAAQALASEQAMMKVWNEGRRDAA